MRLILLIIAGAWTWNLYYFYTVWGQYLGTQFIFMSVASFALGTGVTHHYYSEIFRRRVVELEKAMAKTLVEMGDKGG